MFETKVIEQTSRWAQKAIDDYWENAGLRDKEIRSVAWSCSLSCMEPNFDESLQTSGIGIWRTPRTTGSEGIIDRWEPHVWTNSIVKRWYSQSLKTHRSAFFHCKKRKTHSNDNEGVIRGIESVLIWRCLRYEVASKCHYWNQFIAVACVIPLKSFWGEMSSQKYGFWD